MSTPDSIIEITNSNTTKQARRKIHQRQKFRKYYLDLLENISDDELQNLFNHKDYINILFLKDEPDLGYWDLDEYRQASLYYFKIKDFLEKTYDIDPRQ